MSRIFSTSTLPLAPGIELKLVLGINEEGKEVFLTLYKDVISSLKIFWIYSLLVKCQTPEGTSFFNTCLHVHGPVLPPGDWRHGVHSDLGDCNICSRILPGTVFPKEETWDHVWGNKGESVFNSRKRWRLAKI